MSRYHMLVFTNPVAGQDEAFNEWYSSQHIPEVLSVPGFVAAQRFQVETPGASDAGGGAAPQSQYLAIYDIESDDVGATLGLLANAVQSGAIAFSPALDRSSTKRVVVREVSPRVTRKS